MREVVRGHATYRHVCRTTKSESSYKIEFSGSWVVLKSSLGALNTDKGRGVGSFGISRMGLTAVLVEEKREKRGGGTPDQRS